MRFRPGNRLTLFRLLLLLPALLLAAWFLIRFWEPAGFKYIQFQCSIFDRNGQLIFTVPNHQSCAFHPDGRVLASHGGSNALTLFDQNDRPVWTADESAHHDMRFAADGESFLVITTEFVRINNRKLRSDCFSIRDLQNKIRHQWCLGDHLQELENLGFRFDRPIEVGVGNRVRPTDPFFEISHANSFYEIPENRYSSQHPAFAKGNYLVNVFGTSRALLILDHELKKVLWHKNMSRFKENFAAYRIDSHDHQIGSDGNILAYFNDTHFNHEDVINSYGICSRQTTLVLKMRRYLQPKPQTTCPLRTTAFSRLVLFNPFTDEIVWQYKDSPPEKFDSKVQGSVSFVKPDRYVYSDITRGGAAFEITTDGRKLWSFVPPVRDHTGQPLKAQSIKPLLNTGFLKSRELF